MAPKTPLVSIIIPTYNRAQFIAAAIHSIIHQTYTNFEILVIDDGSGDNTKNIVQSFNDVRIFYFFQQHNGRSSARNLGILIAKGKYITFLDSDDLYLPEKIEKQVEYLESNLQYSMIYSSAQCIDEQGSQLNYTYQAIDSGWIYEKIAYFLPVTIILPTVMVRKEIFQEIGAFDEKMDRFEDVDMWRRISKKFMIYAMPDVTCLIRTHSDNHIKNQNPEKIIESLEYYKKKILREDNHISTAQHENKINILYEYYISAFSAFPEFQAFANKLCLVSTGRTSFTRKLHQKIKQILLIVTARKITNIISKRKKILFVAMQDSIHTARWINQISTEKYDIYLAAVYGTAPHSQLKNTLKVYYPFRSFVIHKSVEIIKDIFSLFCNYKLPSGGNVNHNIVLKYSNIMPISMMSLGKEYSTTISFGKSNASVIKCFGPKNLVKIIRKIKPDLIHSLEFQLCGYNTLYAKKIYGLSKFPPWIATNWGSDIYYFQNDPEHKKIIQDLLSEIDYYSSECERDVSIARNLGLKKPVMPVMPNTGGINISVADCLRHGTSPSNRKIIMVKGYQHFAGRALIALDAIVACASHLKDYKIILYSTSEEVANKAQKIKETYKLNFEFLSLLGKTYVDHETMLINFSKARIYMGISASDGISTSLLEAMAMGAFPIQTNTSCCEEWIEDGVTGFVVSPYNLTGIINSLKTALVDNNLVDNAAKLNWKTVLERLNSENCTQQANKMYELIFEKEHAK